MFCVSFEANTFYISISDGQLLAEKTKYTVVLTYRNLQKPKLTGDPLRCQNEMCVIK